MRYFSVTSYLVFNYFLHAVFVDLIRKKLKFVKMYRYLRSIVKKLLNKRCYLCRLAPSPARMCFNSYSSDYISVSSSKLDLKISLG